jgi:hypothetical protein
MNSKVVFIRFADNETKRQESISLRFRPRRVRVRYIVSTCQDPDDIGIIGSLASDIVGGMSFLAFFSAGRVTYLNIDHDMGFHTSDSGSYAFEVDKPADCPLVVALEFLDD